MLRVRNYGTGNKPRLGKSICGGRVKLETVTLYLHPIPDEEEEPANLLYGSMLCLTTPKSK